MQPESKVSFRIYVNPKKFYLFPPDLWELELYDDRIVISRHGKERLISRSDIRDVTLEGKLIKITLNKEREEIIFGVYKPSVFFSFEPDMKAAKALTAMLKKFVNSEA